jgi:hypothetical protein
LRAAARRCGPRRVVAGRGASLRAAARRCGPRRVVAGRGASLRAAARRCGPRRGRRCRRLVPSLRAALRCALPAPGARTLVDGGARTCGRGFCCARASSAPPGKGCAWGTEGGADHKDDGGAREDDARAFGARAVTGVRRALDGPSGCGMVAPPRGGGAAHAQGGGAREAGPARAPQPCPRRPAAAPPAPSPRAVLGGAGGIAAHRPGQARIPACCCDRPPPIPSARLHLPLLFPHRPAAGWPQPAPRTERGNGAVGWRRGKGNVLPYGLTVVNSV